MVKLSKETHLEMFAKMERIREFDSRINKLVRRGFVQGMTHFSVGEEAANVGAVQHLSYDDIFFSNHRGHGQSIAQDMDLNKMMAELAGKATGVSKGRGGSMHLADFKKGNYGTNGIVGGGYALAIVEVESYRWFGHSTADAGVYRTKEEVDEWKNNNDPIIKYRDYLVSENIASAEELDAIQSQVKAEVDAAYEFAQNSPDPELSVAFEDVWVD